MTIYSILMSKCRRLLTNEYQISTKDYVRIYKLFMQNKANFIRFSPENDDFTKKQSQFKPKQTQFKPKFIKVYPRVLLTWLATGDLFTLKGANSKKNKCKLLCYQGIIKSKQKALEKPPLLEVNSEPLRKDL